MNIAELISNWQLSFASAGDNTLITGSPNRTERRFLFSDAQKNFYIAEGYNSGKTRFQIRQNILLEYLAGQSLSGIHPFIRTDSGTHGVPSDGLFWQLRPYIPAEKLPRTALGQQENYGQRWGEFLLQLKEIMTAPAAPAAQNAPFYMANHLPSLLELSQRKMPEITGQLREISGELAPFFKWERQSSGMFAHGDFHPGNILMSNGKIQAVIDWEFAGIKFPGYDMALLIGCLAMDDPDNLDSPAVRRLQDLLYRNEFMPDEAWEYLPQMIAATRLGWLGEWLSLDETALVKQEMELLAILLENFTC